jgi:alkylhydroperoxidase family enzyme
MEPMYLAGVEENPKPGPYCDLVRAMQRSGREYPQIWHLFAFLPEAGDHLARFTQRVMRGPAPLSAGMRELIAAYTSYRNDCPF